MMQVHQTIHCPNCGNLAQRLTFTSDLVAHLKCPNQQVTQVECDGCDYLMVACALNGSVVEAHPFISVCDRLPIVEREPVMAECHPRIPISIRERIIAARNEARLVCQRIGDGSAACAVAWDIVEELQAAAAHAQVA